MTFDRSLAIVARRIRERNRRIGMPTGLTGRIVSALPRTVSGATRPMEKQAQLAPRVYGAILVAVAVGVAFASRQMTFKRAGSKAPQSQSATIVPTATSLLDTPTTRLSAEIKAAIEQSNTWHLSIRASAKAPGMSPDAKPSFSHTEIWGQHNPFFYREERENETLLDDGVKCYHILAARIIPTDETTGTPSHRVPQVIVVQPSAHSIKAYMPAYNTSSGMSLTYPLDGRTGYLPNLKRSAADRTRLPEKETTLERTSVSNYLAIGKALLETTPANANVSITFRSDLIIDSQTLLPLRYFEKETKKNKYLAPGIKAPTPDANLTKMPHVTDDVKDEIIPGARRLMPFDEPSLTKDVVPTYNCILPPRVLAFSEATDALTFEISPSQAKGSAGTGIGVAGASKSPTTLSPSPHAEARGLTLSANVIGNDDSGVVSCRLLWRLGGKLFSYKDLAAILPFRVDNLTVSDDQGNRYLALVDFEHKDDQSDFIVAAPIEPYVAGSPLPKCLVVALNLSLGLRNSNYKIDWRGQGFPGSLTIQIDPRRRTEADTNVAYQLLPLTPSEIQRRLAAARSTYYCDHLSANAAAAAGGKGLNGVTVNSTATSRLPPGEAARMHARAVYWTSIAAADAERDEEFGAARTLRARLDSLAPDASRSQQK